MQRWKIEKQHAQKHQLHDALEREIGLRQEAEIHENHRCGRQHDQPFDRRLFEIRPKCTEKPAHRAAVLAAQVAQRDGIERGAGRARRDDGNTAQQKDEIQQNQIAEVGQSAHKRAVVVKELHKNSSLHRREQRRAAGGLLLILREQQRTRKGVFKAAAQMRIPPQAVAGAVERAARDAAAAVHLVQLVRHAAHHAVEQRKRREVVRAQVRDAAAQPRILPRALKQRRDDRRIGQCGRRIQQARHGLVAGFRRVAEHLRGLTEELFKQSVGAAAAQAGACNAFILNLY